MNDAEDKPYSAEIGEEHVVYQLHEWALEDRLMAEAVLRSEELPRAWEGTTLRVPKEVMREVEECLDDVVASASAGLDPEADKVAYEIADWPVDHQQALGDALRLATIPFEWDSAGDLFVLAEDEDKADDVFEELELPDAEQAEKQGMAVHSLMSDLFVAADRLSRNARDSSGVLDLVRTSASLGEQAVPYGFPEKEWQELVKDANTLAEELETGDPTDEEIVEVATSVRDRLHPLV